MMFYPEGPDDPRATFAGNEWKYTRDRVAQMTAFEAKSAGSLASANMKQSLSACTPAPNLHQRIYAPSGRFYSTNWGYYVIGTTHYDYQELCGGWSGKSEDAEKAVCQDAVVALAYTGGACYRDGMGSFSNATATYNDGGHYWMNDGSATEALVN